MLLPVLTLRFPLPVVQPELNWIPSMKHDRSPKFEVTFPQMVSAQQARSQS
jgi:hypothetical protein